MTLRLLSGAARSRGEFCVAFGDSDSDNNYSYIISHSEGARQPWSRRDVQRNIEDIIVDTNPKFHSLFIALSDQGDVYFLSENEKRREHVSNNGGFGDEGNINGLMNYIALIENSLFVGGQGVQVFHRLSDGQWPGYQAIQFDLPAGFTTLGVGAISGLSKEDVYACTILSPSQAIMDENLRAKIEEAARIGDIDEMERLYRSIEDSSKVDESRLIHFDGRSWNVVAVPRAGSQYTSPALLRDIFIEAPDRIWAVGTGGAMLVGNAREGFTNVSFHGDQQGLLSITKFQDRMVIASDYALHTFDDHILSPLKPRLRPEVNRNIPTPLKVQAVDDFMFYFDYKHGIHRWDGENWEEIVIPPELLEREFKGLRPRR